MPRVARDARRTARASGMQPRQAGEMQARLGDHAPQVSRMAASVEHRYWSQLKSGPKPMHQTIEPMPPAAGSKPVRFPGSFAQAPTPRHAQRLAGTLRATMVMASPLSTLLPTPWIKDGTAEEMLPTLRPENAARRIRIICIRQCCKRPPGNDQANHHAARDHPPHGRRTRATRQRECALKASPCLPARSTAAMRLRPLSFA